MTVQEQVRAFILEYFYVSDPLTLTDEMSLIDSGVVDSTGMMGVIVFLEGEYGIHIDDHETIPENLESISRIGAYVERKMRASPPVPHAPPVVAGEASQAGGGAIAPSGEE